MPVYVDNLRKWSTKIRCFKSGSCHMVGPEDELHDMAQRLGLKRAWFQNHGGLAHYDLTVSKRAMAIGLGVLERDVYTCTHRTVQDGKHVFSEACGTCPFAPICADRIRKAEVAR